MKRTRIIPAGPDEVGTIRSIAHRTWPDTFGAILSAEQIDYMLEMMYSVESLSRQMDEGHVFHILLVHDDDPMYPSGSADYAQRSSHRYRAVGYVSHQRDYAPGVTKIHKLYLLPGSQGKGYGSQLVRYVVQQAIKAGQQELRLDVNYRNGALAFYERLGFRRLGRKDTDIGGGYLMEDWQLGKELTQQ